MRTITAQYENSHGKKPRGWGNWWFEITGTDNNGRYLTEQYQQAGTLTEAKRQAVRRAKNEAGGVKDIVEVIVLP